ncbi:hypothetical protein [Janthinobacterium sp. PSPC3-1]|uniref:hypothetical protein n=1 Tax=Janthinobacterium sp. PSPC3-1 TaxID=2804653 RepID=UPI003CF3FACD
MTKQTHMNIPTKHYSVANCFSSYLLPHILFVPEFELRKKAVMTCCLGWNLSLFSDAEREEHIDRLWKLFEVDNQGTATTGMVEQGFKLELRMLIVQKLDLFPWVRTHIPKADLSSHAGHDVLIIATGNAAAEEIKIATCPSPLGLPLIIDTLRTIQSDTAAQAEQMLERVVDIPQAISDIDATRMVTLYGVQRADLVSYRRMLTMWHDSQPAPSVRRVINHWQSVVDEIEADTNVVLNILARCS